jgi:RHS repeat-associated protein
MRGTTAEKSCRDRTQRSTRVICDGNGEVVWTATLLDAYGTVAIDDRVGLQYAGRWPGHWWDDDIALQYNRFRWYDVRAGCYIESDPLGTAGGVNLYAYAANPTARVDLLGLTGAGRCGGSDPPHPRGAGPEPMTERVRRVLAQHVVEPVRKFVQRQVEAARNVARQQRGEHGGQIKALIDRNIGAGLSRDEAARHMWDAIHEVTEPEALAQAEQMRRQTEINELEQAMRPHNERIERVQIATQTDVMIQQDKTRTREERRQAAERVGAALGDPSYVAARRERDQINARIRMLRSESQGSSRDPNRVLEAAYDPHSGRLVVARSGGELPRHLRLAPFSIDTTVGGKCGMPHAADLIQQGRAPSERSAPVYTTHGGLSYDRTGTLEHVTACHNCRVLGAVNPQIQWVGRVPSEVLPGTGANRRTPITPRLTSPRRSS